MMDETMTGLAIPLADSVRDAILAAMKAHRWTPSDEDAFWVTTDATLADIAACERLAKTVCAQIEAGDDSTDWGKDHPTEYAAQRAREAEYADALAAYREAVDRG